MTCLCLDIKEGETLRINGAVISFEKRTRIRLHNKCAFLLEKQTMAEDDATTPLRRAYLAVQEAYMERDSFKQLELTSTALKTLRSTVVSGAGIGFFRAAALSHLEEGRYYRALAELRQGIQIDDEADMPVPASIAISADLAAA